MSTFPWMVWLCLGFATFKAEQSLPDTKLQEKKDKEEKYLEICLKTDQRWKVSSNFRLYTQMLRLKVKREHFTGMKIRTAYQNNE